MTQVKHVIKNVTNSSVTIGTSSTQILPQNNARSWALIVNDSNENIYVSVNEAAVMNKGAVIYPGGHLEITPEFAMWLPIYGICSSGGKNVTYIDAS